MGGTEDRRGALKQRPEQTDYEVGYGKPPTAHRFAKGRSGNPKGRPKGSKNKLPARNEERLKMIILEEAYRDITVRDGDRMVSVPMAQAVMRTLAINAAKGQHRAQRLFSELLSTTERQNKALANEWLEIAIGYKLDWDRELQRRERLGITHLPPPLPHPDHVKIDMHRGTARIFGPATKEEKTEHDMWMARTANFEAERVRVRERLEEETDEERRAFLEEDLTYTQEMLDTLRALPPEV